MRFFWAFLAILITAAAATGGWWWSNRPVPLALSFDETFPSVSFAPFRRGQGPLNKIYPDATQVEEDLKSLIGVAKGIRTYTSGEGLQVVPELARRYGFDVIHSAWLGAKPTVNATEVDGLIAAANAYPDVIKRVIVGNEVLLRQDLTVDALISNIRKVKSQIQQPVSYADVWAFYLRYPQIADEVDYLTIHILPYWEDEPVSVADAAAHVVKIYALMKERFPNKPILIGEIGWPTRGRNRGPASVSMEDAAEFVRTVAQLAHTNGFDYNLVEAFDQPWKAKMEGTVGAFWGVVDQNRQVKYAMSGPVIANPQWVKQTAIAVTMGILATILAFYRRLDRYTVPKMFTVAAMAQILCTLVVWQAMNALWIATTAVADLWAWARIILQTAFAALLFQVVAQSLYHGKTIASRWAERLYFLYGLCAVAVTVLLFVNGRYMDIPVLEFLVPCFGVTLWGILRWSLFHKGWRDAFAIGHLFGGDNPAVFGPAGYMARALLAMAFLAPLSESLALWRGEDFTAMHPDLDQQIPLLAQIFWANHEILVWSIMLLLLSLPYWAQKRIKTV